jgi:hypothetical protein
MQYSIGVNNGRLDSIETVTGASPKLRFLSGAPPVNCGAAETGTLLAQQDLPADWMSAAAAGVKAKLGTWSGTGVAAGTIGYFRITNTAGTVAHIQGTCGIGSGDMQLDNTSIASGQVVTVSTFQITAANV